MTDERPGIRRIKAGKGFRYVWPESEPVRDQRTRARIKSLVIPPAWTQVWICPVANGHLQVTGRDARGRKQSRYHPKWRESRDEKKYEHMKDFADALPLIRVRVKEDLGRQGLPREKVLAAIVNLMEQTHIRVGNTEYVKENGSYGLTTMRNKHVEVNGSEVTFSFRGKSKRQHTVSLHDRRLARIIRRCEELPGYELFQYVDGDGTRHSIDSSDVNEYLRETTKQYFTAKDFRTWAGTVMACGLLRQMEPFESEPQAKKNVVAVIKAVAAALGNTPAVCRKCYVHPAVLEAYVCGALKGAAPMLVRRPPKMRALREEECALVDLLEQSRALEKAA
jgi:DNA topoisomerase-1